MRIVEECIESGKSGAGNHAENHAKKVVHPSSSPNENKDQILKLLSSRLLPSQECSSGLARLALSASRKPDALYNKLLEHGIPELGLDEFTIEWILRRLSSMDANNNPDGCGVGEREGRIFSDLVRRRHYGLAHGIGRSGNLTEIQPKAPGSAIIQRLVTRMAIQAIKVAGLIIPRDWDLVVVPMATGMALNMALRAIAIQRPLGAKKVLMPRIDQKSCIKAVLMAGFELIMVPNSIINDAITTDLKALEDTIRLLGSESIVAILTTSSCFAPRLPDKLIQVGQICLRWGIPQLVNNAYGLQTRSVCHHLNEAIKQGSVQAVVQSTDKNFMVPVGGAIILGPCQVIDIVKCMYPGRASIASLVDLFITFLAMGRTGYQKLLDDRQKNFDLFRRELVDLQAILPIRVLDTIPQNEISMAIHILNEEDDGIRSVSTKIDLGSFLFTRGVSGARFVKQGGNFVIDDEKKQALCNFGMHHDDYPATPYLTVASAIGQSLEEIIRFRKLLKKYFSKR